MSSGRVSLKDALAGLEHDGRNASRSCRYEVVLNNRAPRGDRITGPCGGVHSSTTFGFGVIFLALEIHEFAGMVAMGDGPTRSAILSGFFAPVSCHGLHVTLGLLWLLTMMAQVYAKGYRGDILRRLLCFSLFWHTLDIVWVALFTVVLLRGSGSMSQNRVAEAEDLHRSDTAPGDERAGGNEIARGLRSYLLGIVLAGLLTVVSFTVSRTTLVWTPGIPVALFVLAVAQIGVHIVFFLHITSGAASVSNAMALAFGVLIVTLLIGGSLFIMTHLNHNMMPMDRIMQMQRWIRPAARRQSVHFPQLRSRRNDFR